MKHLLLSAVLAAGTLAAAAQTLGAQASGLRQPLAAQTYSLRQSQGAQATSTLRSRVQASSPLHKAPARQQRVDALDYGTKVTVLTEDFAKFATGSVGDPDESVSLINPDYKYPWINILDDYTQTPGWGGFNLYPAGGTACIDTRKDYGHINTPMLNLAQYDRVAVLTFKARTDDGKTVDNMVVEGAETYNMSPTWTFLESHVCPTITDEWQTYEFQFTQRGEYTLLNIVPKGQETVYLDDIEVYVIDPYVAMPLTKPYTNYQGTSFDANWQPVDGAEYYLVNLYTYSTMLGEMEPYRSDLRADGTQLHIDGLTSGETYYYTVRAVKGDHQSLESTFEPVFDLEAPVLNPVDSQGETLEAYSASWNPVPSAQTYNYWAYSRRVAETDGAFTVTDENFDRLKLADGSDPTYTMEDHEYDVYGNTYLNGLNQAGWNGQNYMAYAEGFACVDAYHYLYNGEQAGIISPELDLSKDGGNISLSVRLCGENAAYWDVNGDKHEGVVQCAVALFNYSEETGSFEQAELVYTDEVKADWQTFNVQLTQGAARSKVGIFGVRYPGNLYIDDVNITQRYKAGESLLDPYHYAFMHVGASIEVPLPNSLAGRDLYHKVSAVKVPNVPGVTVSYKESAFSPLEQVHVKASGITAAQSAANGLQLQGSRLTVSNPDGAEVAVYSADGRLVASGSQAHTAVTLPARGVYLVKVAGRATRIAY